MALINRWKPASLCLAILTVFFVTNGCGGGENSNQSEAVFSESQADQQAIQTADQQADQQDDQTTHSSPETASNTDSRMAAETQDRAESLPVDYQSSDRTAERGADGSGMVAKPGEHGSGAAHALSLPELPAAASRKAAPKTQLTDIAGHKMSLDSFTDETVLVVFWATWCPPCKAEIPHLVQLQEKYGESGLKILGLSLDRGGLPEVKKFLKSKREINYTIIPNGQLAAHEFGQIRSIPTTILLDKKGRIVKRFVGLVPEKEMESWIVATMRENI